MAYKTTTWAKAKADYESGNFIVAQLQKKYRIHTSTIDKRIATYKWIKGASKKKIQERIQETMKEKFARLGLPEDKVLEKVKEVIDENPKAGLDYYFKLVGSYAPMKREITGKDGSALLPTSKMTKEELIKQLESL